MVISLSESSVDDVFFLDGHIPSVCSPRFVSTG